MNRAHGEGLVSHWCLLEIHAVMVFAQEYMFAQNICILSVTCGTLTSTFSQELSEAQTGSTLINFDSLYCKGECGCTNILANIHQFTGEVLIKQAFIAFRSVLFVISYCVTSLPLYLRICFFSDAALILYNEWTWNFAHFHWYSFTYIVRWLNTGLVTMTKHWYGWHFVLLSFSSLKWFQIFYLLVSLFKTTASHYRRC